MKVVVITPPTPIVTKEEAKKHLLVDHPDDDTLIEALILAATQWIDGPAGWLGRALGEQELELSGWFGCGAIGLPYPPIISAVEIVTEDDDGNQETADPASYRLRDGEIIVASGASWVARPYHRIRYKAGYSKPDPSDATKRLNDAPASIKVAILLLVAQWYRTREPVAIGATVETLPFGVEALLSPYRVYR